jgi:hypothetical protein
MSAAFYKAQNNSMLKVHGTASRRQRGAIGIMTALLLPVLIGFLALALDLGRIYNRKTELQALAEGVAISAARKLDGTPEGVSNAIAAAQGVITSGTEKERNLHYAYRKTPTVIDAAIKFGTSPNGGAGWMNADAAKASPAGVAYVRVDTNDLGESYGKVDMFLIQILGNFQPMHLSHVTVAGRQRIKITPLAICEMSKDPDHPFKERTYTDGTSELTEYGFRRGVSYNLMKLSPHTSDAVNYVVDPISLSSDSLNFGTDVVGPYVCTGTVELPRVIGQKLNLQSTFPLGQYVNHLNSRFNTFSTTTKECNAKAAPPDTNIKSFTYGTSNLNWMTNPGRQAADLASTANRLETIADLDPSVSPPSATSYGPLWVFARAVPWSAYTAGVPEPAGGYVPFAATPEIWKSLYSPGPSLSGYPADANNVPMSPYLSTQTAGAPPTNYPGIKYRRLLNIPLLRCPAGAAPEHVVAIGRFFMTVPATSTAIYAEFAGVTLQEEAAGPVELYQ